MSVVYFIHDASADAVKIGFSRNPARRMAKMQSECPGRLALLATVSGGADAEAQLHRRFAAYRLRGEWFRASPELLGYIGTLCQHTPRPKHYSPRSEMIVRYMDATGVGHAVARSWVYRCCIPGRYWAALARAGVATLEQLAAYHEAALDRASALQPSWMPSPDDCLRPAHRKAA